MKIKKELTPAEIFEKHFVKQSKLEPTEETNAEKEYQLKWEREHKKSRSKQIVRERKAKLVSLIALFAILFVATIIQSKLFFIAIIPFIFLLLLFILNTSEQQ